jgi:dUTP pyrophosphatase
MSELLFAKLNPDAIIPSKRDEDAGYDIYPVYDKTGAFLLYPHTTTAIPTGLASVIPEGYYGQIQERGSTGVEGIKYGAGVIDSGYRGEWFICLTNTNEYPILIFKDDASYREAVHNLKVNENIVNAKPYGPAKAIAQVVLHKVPEMEVREITAEELKTYGSERGTGALGSSNK